MITTMILKITNMWVKVLKITIDNLDPNREVKEEIREKMGVLKEHIDTIQHLKRQRGI